MKESENKTLHVLRVEPGKVPEEKDIGSDLHSLQAEVDGLIECVYMDDGTIIVVNEEGKLNGMEMNRRLGDDIICGPFFLVGDDGEGDFASLSDEQITALKAQFSMPDKFNDYEPDAQPHIRFISL